jgi:glycosyltransferase involved in cell wall biosynthesis
MRRILLLITDLKIGGTPTVVRELASRLRSPDAHVEVACLSPWGPVADQLTAVGVPVTALNAARSADVLVIRRLIRLVRTGAFDTVFSFLIHANAVAAAASLFCRNVRFIQSIQTTQPKPRWHWWLQRIVHRAADHLVMPSESIAQVARDWSDVPAGKIVIIPNAIEPDDYAVGSSTAAARGAGGAPLPIGFIGRLDPIKRIPDLLEAVHQLGDRVHLHIFGEGAERPHIEAEIARLGLTNAVTLHGAIPHPQDALRQIRLLVLPSAAEGFGLVLIEAMAAGIPVVATDAPGIRNVVHHNQTGLLVPVASPAALAQALARLIDDAPLRDSLIRQAAADVRQRFTWHQVLPQYRALLGLTSGAPPLM